MSLNRSTVRCHWTEEPFISIKRYISPTNEAEFCFRAVHFNIILWITSKCSKQRLFTPLSDDEFYAYFTCPGVLQVRPILSPSLWSSSSYLVNIINYNALQQCCNIFVTQLRCLILFADFGKKCHSFKVSKNRAVSRIFGPRTAKNAQLGTSCFHLSTQCCMVTKSRELP